jgi:hypothetical protein
VQEVYFRLGRAAALLNTTKYILRQLWKAGSIKGHTTESGELMVLASEVTRIREQQIPLVPPRIMDVDDEDEDDFPIEAEPQPASASHTVDAVDQPSAPVRQSADDVVITENRLRRRKLDRKLEKVEDFFRDRQSQEAAERQSREAADRQRQIEAEAQRRRREWVQGWQTYAINHVKIWVSDAPPEARLDIPVQVAEALNKTDPDQPSHAVRILIDAAIEKALKPWRRQKAVDEIVAEAVNRLPARARSCFTPTTWQTRATCGAYQAIKQAGESSSLAEIEAVVRQAVESFIHEFEHKEECEHILGWVRVDWFNTSEQAEAVEVVGTMLAGAPVGCSKRRLEQIRDEALKPLRERIAVRLDQEMRQGVLARTSIPQDFPPALKEDALQAVRKTLDQLPRGSSRQPLEEARDQVVKQFTSRFQKQKQQDLLIEEGLRAIPPYLLALERNWEFDENRQTLEATLREPVRRKLAAALTGDESADDVARKVRRIVRLMLGITLGSD